jgi:hypothetical protein
MEAKGILLDHRLKNSLPKLACYDKEPCDKCKEYMKQGIILISVRDGEGGDNPYRTGGWTVIKEEAVRRMFKDVDLYKRVAFVHDSVWDMVGLPREKKEAS